MCVRYFFFLIVQLPPGSTPTVTLVPCPTLCRSMVQAGAKAIVIYPISPTALNHVIKNACAKNVQVFAYDAEVTEPCAHNVTIDQEEAGRTTAQWLADKIGRAHV